MIPTAFDYVRAGSLREALSVLAQGDGTKVIAGGHSLLPVMKFRLAQPPKLVDISRPGRAAGHRRSTGRARGSGRRPPTASCSSRSCCASGFRSSAKCTENIGDLQVRNRGTIGGSLAHADPASDMPSVMLALDATFNLRSKRGAPGGQGAGVLPGTVRHRAGRRRAAAGDHAAAAAPAARARRTRARTSPPQDTRSSAPRRSWPGSARPSVTPSSP